MTDTLKILVFVILTGLWLSEFLFFPSPKKESLAGKKSFYLVLAGILVSILFSIIMFLTETALITGRNGALLRGVSLVLYAFGVFLRYWSSRLLGEDFSRSIAVRRDQDLVSRGPYRVLRHPLYTALMIMVVSVSLFLQSIPGIVFALVVMTAVLGVRIKEEERIMEEHLGERYIRWKEKRQLLIPFVI